MRILKDLRIRLGLSEEDLLRIKEKYKFVKLEESLKEYSSFYKVLVEKINFKNPQIILGFLYENKELFVPVGTEISMFDFQLNTGLELNLIRYTTPELFDKAMDPNIVFSTNYYDNEILFLRVAEESRFLKASDIHLHPSFYMGSNKKQYNIYYRVGNDVVPSRIFKSVTDLELGDVFEANLDCIYLNAELFNALTELTVRDRTLSSVTDINSKYGIQTSILDVFRDQTTSIRFTSQEFSCGHTTVCRLTNEETDTILRMDELGFDKDTIMFLLENALASNGLFLVSGEIRTGKNVTLKSIVLKIMEGLKVKEFGLVDFEEYLIPPNNKVILEYSSPIEGKMPFPMKDYQGDVEVLLESIRAIKKMDCDILLLNEIPDKNTAQAVLSAVNSSIFTMTTIHINRIWQMIYKLYEYYGNDYFNILSQLNGIINQRLFNRQCPHCLEQYTVDKFRYTPAISKYFDDFDIKVIKQSKGCEVCNYTKKGKIPVVVPEYVRFTHDFKSRVNSCTSLHSVEELIKEEVYKSENAFEFRIKKHLMNGLIAVTDLIKVII